MVILEVRLVSLADIPLVDRMVVCKKLGTDEVPLIRQRVGTYGIVLSERGLLGMVISWFTGVPGTWNLPGGGLDAGEEPTVGPLREVHEEAGQQVVPGWLPTLQSDHWVDCVPNGGLEDYYALHIIHSTTCEELSCPCVHDLGGLAVRVDWTPVKSQRRIPQIRAVRQVLSQHLPSH